MPHKQRQSVAYHYLAGLPYTEVASILGGTTEAARRAAADGIASLRRSTGIFSTSHNRTIDSPAGSLLLAATETGLVRVAYANEDHDRVLQALSDRISPRILHHPPRLDATARELDEYFAGRRHTFSLTGPRRRDHRH
ncbi:hypothetical protein [Nocardioides sp.]|uniref:hypothetical protein n=1 Tax=Nocardioides sp. TaxID=35761 RepID=UPI00286D84FF|nr:hypothetical protein [Nocardioides sp.]